MLTEKDRIKNLASALHISLERFMDLINQICDSQFFEISQRETARRIWRSISRTSLERFTDSWSTSLTILQLRSVAMIIPSVVPVHCIWVLRKSIF